MDTVEEAIRETLDRHVGAPPVRPMPSAIRSRVRRRQIGSIATVTVAAAAAAFVAVVGLTALPLHHTPSNEPAASGPTAAGGQPLESVPSGWPRVQIGDPADGYTMPPDVADAVGPVRVIASGTVNGAGFSFQSYVGGGRLGEWTGPCLGFAGPGLAHFASPPPQPPGAVGGISSATCANGQGVPARTDLFLTGQEDPDQAPGLAANYGFLSPRVDRLVLRLDEGDPVDIPILESPPGWDGVQAFLFFPPEGVIGTLVAYSADGSELTRAPMCTYSDRAAFGCGGGGTPTQLAPIP